MVFLSFDSLTHHTDGYLSFALSGSRTLRLGIQVAFQPMFDNVALGVIDLIHRGLRYLYSYVLFRIFYFLFSMIER